MRPPRVDVHPIGEWWHTEPPEDAGGTGVGAACDGDGMWVDGDAILPGGAASDEQLVTVMELGMQATLHPRGGGRTGIRTADVPDWVYRACADADVTLAAAIITRQEIGHHDGIDVDLLLIVLPGPRYRGQRISGLARVRSPHEITVGELRDIMRMSRTKYVVTRPARVQEDERAGVDVILRVEVWDG